MLVVLSEDEGHASGEGRFTKCDLAPRALEPHPLRPPGQKLTLSEANWLAGSRGHLCPLLSQWAPSCASLFNSLTLTKTSLLRQIEWMHHLLMHNLPPPQRPLVGTLQEFIVGFCSLAPLFSMAPPQSTVSGTLAFKMHFEGMQHLPSADLTFGLNREDATFDADMAARRRFVCLWRSVMASDLVTPGLFCLFGLALTPVLKDLVRASPALKLLHTNALDEELFSGVLAAPASAALVELPLADGLQLLSDGWRKWQQPITPRRQDVNERWRAALRTAGLSFPREAAWASLASGSTSREATATLFDVDQFFLV
jgi:hypothetical protein